MGKVPLRSKRAMNPVLIGVHAPSLLRAEAGQRDRAGKQLQRAAFRVVHDGVARERERGDLAAQIAGQLEVLQGDARPGGEGNEQEQGNVFNFCFHNSISI